MTLYFINPSLSFFVLFLFTDNGPNTPSWETMLKFVNIFKNALFLVSQNVATVDRKNMYLLSNMSNT